MPRSSHHPIEIARNRLTDHIREHVLHFDFEHRGKAGERRVRVPRRVGRDQGAKGALQQQVQHDGLDRRRLMLEREVQRRRPDRQARAIGFVSPLGVQPRRNLDWRIRAVIGPPHALGADDAIRSPVVQSASAVST